MTASLQSNSSVPERPARSDSSPLRHFPGVLERRVCLSVMRYLSASRMRQSRLPRRSTCSTMALPEFRHVDQMTSPGRFDPWRLVGEDTKRPVLLWFFFGTCTCNSPSTGFRCARVGSISSGRIWTDTTSGPLSISPTWRARQRNTTMLRVVMLRMVVTSGSRGHSMKK